MKTVYKVKNQMYTKEVLAAVAEASQPPLKKCAALVEAEAKISMKKGGSVSGLKRGQAYVYWHSKLKRYVQASKPGTPPHKQFGALVSGIITAPSGRGTYFVGVRQEVWYGKLHEWGGQKIHEQGGKYHPKRPFMRPALVKVMKQFPRFFRNLRLADTAAGRRLNSRKGKKGF